jgi:hypothetical protein
MLHYFVGFAHHFGEYSNLLEDADKMAVAAIELICGTPQDKQKKIILKN